MPKEAFCEVNSQFKIGLPPDAVWNILIDPGNKRVFKNIKVNCVLLFYPSQSRRGIEIMKRCAVS